MFLYELLSPIFYIGSEETKAAIGFEVGQISVAKFMGISFY